MADGEIVFSFTADDKDAQKKLAQLRREIDRTAKAIENTGAKKDGITQQLEAARAAARQTADEIAKVQEELNKTSSVLTGMSVRRNNDMASVPIEDWTAANERRDAQLAERTRLLALQKQQEAEVAKLEKQEQNVLGTLKQQTAQLETQKAEAGAIERATAERSSGIMSKVGGVAAKLGGVVRGLFGGMPKLGGAIDNVKASMQSSVKTMLKWGLGVTSAVALLKRLSGAIKESISTFAKYDKETEASINSLKASLQSLKINWGAAFAPIINAVAPLLQKLISMLSAAANAVAQFFAALGGATTYKRAIKSNKALADSYGGAGGAAEEAEKQIMGFDEINKLNDNKGGGGGGGGSVEDAIEKVPVSQAIKDFVADFKNAVLNGDWQGLGELLGNKVNDIFASIDWAGIGKKIGYWINGLIQTIYFFLKTVDFKAIGRYIAALINNALSQIDFTYLGRLLIRRLTLVYDMLLGAILELDWKQIGKSIGDVLRGAFDELTEWLESYDWSEVAEQLWQNVKDAIEGFDAATVAEGMSEFLETATNSLIDFISGIDFTEVVSTIFGLLSDFISGFDTEGVVASLLGLLTTVLLEVPLLLVDAIATLAETLGEMFESVGLDCVAGIFKGISDKMKEAGKWLKENLVDPIIDWVKEFFGIASPSTEFASIATDLILGLIQGLWDGLTGLFMSLGEWAKGILDKVKEFFGISGSGYSSIFSDIGKSLINGLLEGLQETWNNVRQWFSDQWNALKSWWEGLSLGAFDFKTPHLEVTWEDIPGDSILARFLGFTQIPHIGINWYARGGIVDGATLIGAGEAGKEAIVPLERNTEWIRMVANGIVEALTSSNKLADYISNMELPSVLRGNIVPPRALNGGSMFTDGDIQKLVSGITAVMSQNDGPIDNRIYIDGRQFAEVMTKYQRRMERGYA